MKVITCSDTATISSYIMLLPFAQRLSRYVLRMSASRLVYRGRQAVERRLILGIVAALFSKDN